MDDDREPDEGRTLRFTALFRTHHGQISAFARRRLGPDLAQDAVAETFMTAWRRFDDLTGEPLPWLYSLANHAVANQRRSNARRTRLDERARTVLRDGSSEPDHAEGVVETDALASAFRSLSESDRDALRLTTWEGLDPAAAAAVTGCSRSTFTVRVHRARRRLLQLLAETAPDLPDHAPSDQEPVRAFGRTAETS